MTVTEVNQGKSKIISIKVDLPKPHDKVLLPPLYSSLSSESSAPSTDMYLGVLLFSPFDLQSRHPSLHPEM